MSERYFVLDARGAVYLLTLDRAEAIDYAATLNACPPSVLRGVGVPPGWGKFRVFVEDEDNRLREIPAP